MLEVLSTYRKPNTHYGNNEDKYWYTKARQEVGKPANKWLKEQNKRLLREDKMKCNMKTKSLWHRGRIITFQRENLEKKFLGTSRQANHEFWLVITNMKRIYFKRTIFSFIFFRKFFCTEFTNLFVFQFIEWEIKYRSTCARKPPRAGPIISPIPHAVLTWFKTKRCSHEKQ